MKAYLSDGSISLVANGTKQIEFVAGATITAIDELEKANNPYALFKDYKATVFQKHALAKLDKLYASDEKEPAATLVALDNNPQDALYMGKMWKLSFENVAGKAVPVFEIDSAQELLALELFCVINRGKKLKKCACCGNYFFPEGRSDAQYCTRIGKDGYACKKIGANRRYRKQSRLDSVKALYDKVTKHNRYLKSRGLLTESEFERWMKETANMYARFKNEAISAETMTNWLSKELTPSPRPANRREISDYLL